MDIRRNEDAILESLEMGRDEGVSKEVAFVEKVVCQLVLVEGNVGVGFDFDGRFAGFGLDDLRGFGVGCDVEGGGGGSG